MKRIQVKHNKGMQLDTVPATRALRHYAGRYIQFLEQEAENKAVVERAETDDYEANLIGIKVSWRR